MSFTLSFSSAALDALISDAGKQGQFAVVSALTATAKDIEQAETDGLTESLDRPSPFTLKAFGTEPATKAKPTARIFMRPIQSRYLQWQIDGGSRGLKAFELRIRDKTVSAYQIPGDAATLDQHGNVSRADIIAIQRELNSSKGSKRYFVGQPKGRPDLPPGIYARVNNNTSIEPLFIFATSATYRKRFAWSQIAQRTFNATFERNLIAALANAKRTAR